MSFWWLSFVDDERPAGQRHLGCCIVPAEGIVEAAKVAWAMGCNPGGEIAGCEVTQPKPGMIGRMLRPDEIARLARTVNWEDLA